VGFAGAAAGASVARRPPQLAQKRASDRFASPQCGQVAASGEPQLSQNRLPARFSVPQLAQVIGILRGCTAERTGCAQEWPGVQPAKVATA
jgi:hypothetical protein